MGLFDLLGLMDGFEGLMDDFEFKGFGLWIMFRFMVGFEPRPDPRVILMLQTCYQIIASIHEGSDCISRLTQVQT